VRPSDGPEGHDVSPGRLSGVDPIPQAGSAYIVECFAETEPDLDDADQRTRPYRRMFGPFPHFDAAHGWMESVGKTIADTCIIHVLTEWEIVHG
jgi:hypothetical protein